MAEVECPNCKGRGKEVVLHNAASNHQSGFSLGTCSICLGTGKTSAEKANKLILRQAAWDKILNG